MFQKFNHPKKGFTLIELLVVISIISLLASVVLASLNSARSKARDAKRKSDLHQLQIALQLYSTSNNGAYPVSTSFSCWGSNWKISGNAGTYAFYDGLVGGGYISSLPADPGANAENIGGGTGNFLGDNYPTDQCYYYYSDGNTYVLGTNLEHGGGSASNSGNYQVLSP